MDSLVDGWEDCCTGQAFLLGHGASEQSLGSVNKTFADCQGCLVDGRYPAQLRVLVLPLNTDKDSSRSSISTGHHFGERLQVFQSLSIAKPGVKFCQSLAVPLYGSNIVLSRCSCSPQPCLT